MDPFTEFLNIGIDQPIWIAVKILMVIGFAIYMIFALVVIRQVNKMTDTLTVGFETEIRLVAVLHFLLALATFLVALVIL